ncbi:protein-L-isoaspartate O-methyltransferase [Methanosalsum zhilinae DSM 4017]|uniref:Protein-L-isoaspartate O-methyltransferase n=1 Tax=Methanosalsum zhilinae (strain DSM 4017 / NBRC 107636 / OCM 62 / WeN5) TaxID=679901 RepID=F7XKG1_METZD|nr:protein-L-isoaspartate O-methyltransferase [Methanosalsum zhilinae]AEH61732.1 protein-L-isoaspartate O-methyltransferase [Methanosalsum zhilinae DSM 4017]
MEFEEKKKRMINGLKGQGISKKVLDAITKVDRHRFVPEQLEGDAYYDTPLPIGYNQTISAPHMVAMMCDMLDLEEGHRVLEIGAGSGYNAAVMAELIGENGHIYTIERIKPLVDFAKNNLEKAGYSNVTVVHGDGSEGYPSAAPYDRITVTSAAPEIPEIFLEQLKPEGILLIPVGIPYQELYLVRKDLDGNIHKEPKGGVMFVPLVGKYGFRKDDGY